MTPTHNDTALLFGVRRLACAFGFPGASKHSNRRARQASPTKAAASRRTPKPGQEEDI